MAIIRQAKDREDVQYFPKEEEGSIYYSVQPNLRLDGTHMILTRCNYQLKKWIHYLKTSLEPWHNPYRPTENSWNPTNTQIWRAGRAYHQLIDGKLIPGEELLILIKKLRADGNLPKGFKTKAKDIIKKKAQYSIFDIAQMGWDKDLLQGNKLFSHLFNDGGQAGNLLQSIWGSPKKIIETPRIIVSTVHGCKGGEADHVWFDTSSTKNINQACMKDRLHFYDECRVAYVAVTRAKQSFGFIRRKGLQNPALTMAVT